MDIYTEVAKVLNTDRNTIKRICSPLFYSKTPLPKEPRELVDFLVTLIRVQE